MPELGLCSSPSVDARNQGRALLLGWRESRHWKSTLEVRCCRDSEGLEGVWMRQLRCGGHFIAPAPPISAERCTCTAADL